MSVDIRYRKDTGWERRCPDCRRANKGSSWWPLDFEFWNPRDLRNCRGCQRVQSRAYRARRQREIAEKSREWWARLRADPVRFDAYLQRHRAAMRRYRERRAA